MREPMSIDCIKGIFKQKRKSQNKKQIKKRKDN